MIYLTWFESDATSNSSIPSVKTYKNGSRSLPDIPLLNIAPFLTHRATSIYFEVGTGRCDMQKRICTRNSTDHILRSFIRIPRN